jgi:hypothetical protein
MAKQGISFRVHIKLYAYSSVFPLLSPLFTEVSLELATSLSKLSQHFKPVQL